MSDQPRAPASIPRRALRIGLTKAATSRNHFRRLVKELERKLSDRHSEHERVVDGLYLDRAKYRTRVRRIDEFTDGLAGEGLPQEQLKWVNLLEDIGKHYQEQLTKIKADINHEKEAFRSERKEMTGNIRALKASISQLSAVIHG